MSYGAIALHVLLTVADTGVGMSAETKARAFEPFFTTKELGKGTGLGLAMVYGMVEQHGGIIHVYSEPGSGTTFKIYLPVDAKSGPENAPSMDRRLLGGTETILVAEDDPLVRAVIVRVLKNAGYTTLVATDGVEALLVFQQNAAAISLAVLDIVMPHCGGRTLFHQLNEIKPQIRVIFCTGHDPQANQAEAILDQGLPLLQKPIDPILLLQTVRSVLDAPNNARDNENDNESNNDRNACTGLRTRVVPVAITHGLEPAVGLPSQTPT